MFDEIKMASVDCIITNEYKYIYQTYKIILFYADEYNNDNSDSNKKNCSNNKAMCRKCNTVNLVICTCNMFSFYLYIY